MIPTLTLPPKRLLEQPLNEFAFGQTKEHRKKSEYIRKDDVCHSRRFLIGVRLGIQEEAFDECLDI